ncbi:18125_t:CDS:2 [Entrophospora sp. SA101]|nr:6051_t:CDS:2 [Entrophospora sp. SA101]CAJ0633876.1 7888_t:CDS:2 [Entrophospora sp. SA101]CAJ0751377.1 18125_t:CDS:2 [Entrophospora sp. SA101]CAJ0831837.1 13373_t:CDS:2 [Entrophospora sp. SA101]CAJ0891680.1 1382_t:CDS:2 [Entrophospora sp. SA101]
MTSSEPATSSLNYPQNTSYHQSSNKVTLKTSITHPINVSWILPDELKNCLTLNLLSSKLDLFDIYTSASLYQHYYYDQVEKKIQNNDNNTNEDLSSKDTSSSTTTETVSNLGNLALSSCPGKKVRLNGPERGRATIKRDLDLDFQRLVSLGISMIICCLNDVELEFLGAPWPKYDETAQKHNIQIIRIPMIEGGCPDSLDQIDQVVLQIDQHIKQGKNVLGHCRGGVGRAGLVACCWLLKTQFCLDADRAIQLVRMRRSSKAIETLQQVDFIVQYSNYVKWNLNENQKLLSKTTSNHEKDDVKEDVNNNL